MRWPWPIASCASGPFDAGWGIDTDTIARECSGRREVVIPVPADGPAPTSPRPGSSRKCRRCPAATRLPHLASQAATATEHALRTQGARQKVRASLPISAMVRG